MLPACKSKQIFTEQEYINIKQNRQYETWSKISLRDFALFSIVGFSLVYKDTLKYNKLLKAHINTQKEKERLQKDMQSYLAHDHFTKDILNLYIHAHPESQKTCKNAYTYTTTATRTAAASPAHWMKKSSSPNS